MLRTDSDDVLRYAQPIWRACRGESAADLATAYRQLAEMHARGGDHRKAADYQRRFIALWQHADEELQPQIEIARQWLARLRP